MLAAAVASAIDYYSFCPPGANCGTNNPDLNLAIIAVNFFIGLALVVASLIHRSGPRQPS